jgi:hypothetical protein
MRIQFDVTIEDCLDLRERVVARSKVASSWRRNYIAINALIYALILGVASFALSKNLLFAGICWIVAAAVGGGIFWRQYHATLRRRFRKYFQEQFGQRTSLPFEVEMTNSGIRTKMMGTQIIYEWSNVKELEETNDSIALWMHDGGCVNMRKRAFAWPEEQEHFKEVAQDYLTASRTSSNWLKADNV